MKREKKIAVREKQAAWLRAVMCALMVVGAVGPVRGQVGASANQERGVGPMTLVTRHGTYVVRLLRREDKTLWLLQKSQSGQMIEAGIPVSDIVRFNFGKPTIFQTAEQAKTPAQITPALDALKKMAGLLRPFRDLPGMIMDEALIDEGKLLERQNRWAEARVLYEDIIKQTYNSPQANEALLRAGLCCAHEGQNDQALDYLSRATVTDDDLALLSEVYFTRGRILAALGENRDAINHFLYLVVFHPFVQNNEPRCLEAVLPLYIALKDWDATAKTYAALKKNYGNSEYASRAEETVKPYVKELQKEALFADQIETNDVKEGSAP